MPVINSEFSAVIRGSGNRGSVIIDYLCNRFTYHSREEWTSLIRENLIKVNEHRAHENDIVKPGDKITFYVKDYNEPDAPSNYRVLLDLNNLMFVHKPPGLPVIKTGKIFFNTLINLLRRDYNNQNIFLLNRLDRETSGIVVCANGKDNIKKYSLQNLNNNWLKIYAAVVRGDLEDRGIINLPLGEQSDSSIRCQMYPDDDGKSALSFYEILEKKGGESLVVIIPVTGRKHQIRAHLAYQGAPIVGDKIYSNQGRYYLKRLSTILETKDIAILGATHHLLHCFYTCFSDASKNFMESLDWELDNWFLKYFALKKIQDWYYSSRKNEFIKWVNETTRKLKARERTF